LTALSSLLINLSLIGVSYYHERVSVLQTARSSRLCQNVFQLIRNRCTTCVRLLIGPFS